MAESLGGKPAIVGEYELHGAIGKGGYASVHLARKRTRLGFATVVAIKRLAPRLAGDADARRALVDEARTSARVRHANVVQTLDVIEEGGEVFLVLELVVGVSLARLLGAARARGVRVPVPVAVAIVVAVLHGLAAAHEATNGAESLGLIHRDVSPQNVLIDENGIAKLADFGIAKARGRMMSTATDVLKGKLSYMAPEYLRGEPIDARVDLHAAGVVLWETLTGIAAFEGDDDAVVRKILSVDLPAPSTIADVPRGLDDVVRRSVTARATERFASARAMIEALEAAARPATASEVAAFVDDVAAAEVGAVRDAVAAMVPEGGGERERERERVRGGERERGRGRGLGRWIAWGAGGVVAVGVALWSVGGWLGAPRGPATTTATATAAVTPVGSAGEPAPRGVEETAPIGVDEPVAPSATVRRGTRPAHGRAAKPGCDPPWTLDGGIKHYKDECL